MTTLKELSNEDELNRFVSEVSNNSLNYRQKDTTINDGIKSSMELRAIIMNGSRIEFDCKRMIEESNAY